MQTQQHSRQARGPEMFYGYCHDTRRMRLMDYSDYMQNMQTGYTNLYKDPSGSMQSVVNALSSAMRTQATQGKDDCGCGSRQEDCSCECCIRCADVVEYVRCGEVRRIPITFDNDTRRERDVRLELGQFSTEAGQPTGWDASVSTPQIKLPPCGEVTVVVTVNVDCGRLAGGDANNLDQPGRAGVESCKVAYATLRAEGCTIRPIVIAVAVLPEHCGSHRAGCGCSCCN